MPPYPDDVDPESGFRLKLPRREALDELGRALYDRVVDPKGGSIAGLRGPAGIRLLSPKLSQHAQPLGHYLRYEAGLGGRVRELAILTTARECDSQFEWTAHEPEALKEGVPSEIVEIIKHRKSTAGVAPEDAVVIDLAREIFRARTVSKATFARALAQFGERRLVDLVALMGNYAATAALLCAFDMRVSPDKKELLPAT